MKRERGTRVEGQGEGEGVSLLGRWWGVFSFVLLQCVCVLTLTSGAEPQHRTRSQLANNTDLCTQLGERKGTAPSLHNKRTADMATS